MKAFEVYKMYECPRCKKMEFDVKPRPKDWALMQQMGMCKASKLPVMQDFQYSLFKTPAMCENFNKGKPKKK